MRDSSAEAAEGQWVSDVLPFMDGTSRSSENSARVVECVSCSADEGAPRSGGAKTWRRQDLAAPRLGAKSGGTLPRGPIRSRDPRGLRRTPARAVGSRPTRWRRACATPERRAHGRSWTARRSTRPLPGIQARERRSLETSRSSACADVTAARATTGGPGTSPASGTSQRPSGVGSDRAHRASFTIGEFAVLVPGDQEVVLTKEVFVVRVIGGEDAGWTPFYLLWRCPEGRPHAVEPGGADADQPRRRRRPLPRDPPPRPTLGGRASRLCAPSATTSPPSPRRGARSSPGCPPPGRSSSRPRTRTSRAWTPQKATRVAPRRSSVERAADLIPRHPWSRAAAPPPAVGLHSSSSGSSLPMATMASLRWATLPRMSEIAAADSPA
jgi:hypothetical protein